ncbi:unnamed protein product, partial [Vitis vinifera]|uniref:Uncharacterized protein n=1 Tax=Vitis vinifera TaxID=29760 RepID=D7UCQ9_VITVI
MKRIEDEQSPSDLLQEAKWLDQETSPTLCSLRCQCYRGCLLQPWKALDCGNKYVSSLLGCQEK